MYNYHYPGDYGHLTGTKGHSILKQRSYGVTTKRPATDVYLSSAPRHFDSHAEEDSLYQTVGHELISSAHAVDDSYAMAHKSRDRDHQLMSDINHAIVSSEVHSSPRTAVASRRATRHQPAAHHNVHVHPRHVHKEVVVASNTPLKQPSQHARVILIPAHPMARTKPSVVHRAYSGEEKPRVDVGHTRTPVINRVYPTEEKKRVGYGYTRRPIHKVYPHEEKKRVGVRYVRRPIHRAYPQEEKKRVDDVVQTRKPVVRASRIEWPKAHHRLAYAPIKQRKFIPKRHIRARQKAALIGQKVDVVLPERRKPKIYHSAPKPRMHKIEDQDYRGLSSSGLHAHVPGHYPPSQAKAIRDVDGFTDPKNVMSWKYRLEARARPSDLLFHSEHAYESMKDRVLDVQGKLDRHRQLLDRYLTPNLGPETEDVPSQVMNKYTELEARDPMGAGGHYHPISHDSGSHGHHHESHVDVGMTGLPSRQPVSDLRRRLRRVICKSKRDASYYN